MFLNIPTLILGLALQVSAAPSTFRNTLPFSRRNATGFTLPASASDSTARAAAIEVKRATFIYGPSICGNGSYFPAGTLGDARTSADKTALDVTVSAQKVKAVTDSQVALQAIVANGGINKISDYEVLYDGQWATSMPDGLSIGVLTNYTLDSFFAMERLSVNPYSIKRLNPASDTLEFAVDDTIATAVTGQTLTALFNSGSIFYADHRTQANLAPIAGRYAASCDAYFYIHPTSGDFLPLAIRTNTNNTLVYTPQDTENDWLLAKMMFGNNDFFFGQFFHFAATHDVVEGVYEAAYRTLSDDHPVLALFNRMTPQLFSFRLSALDGLLNVGGLVDEYFAWTGADAEILTTELWNQGANKFQANYFETDLITRGLLNATYGPALKHFPFYTDAKVIHTSIKKFVSSFVDSYYISVSDFTADTELQNWVIEAGDQAANVTDFPVAFGRTTLIDTLTHIAFLGSVEHHTLNTFDFSKIFGALSFTPLAFYSPVPTTKNITDIMPFLPDIGQAIGQLVAGAIFHRPTFIHSEWSLSQMFNDTTMLSSMPAAVSTAAATFETEMMVQSAVIEARGFDSDGLSNGCPFLWTALDPEEAPYFLTA